MTLPELEANTKENIHLEEKESSGGSVLRTESYPNHLYLKSVLTVKHLTAALTTSQNFLTFFSAYLISMHIS